MESFENKLDINSSLWTKKYKKEVIQVISNCQPGVKRSRMHYHVHQKFILMELSEITKVSVKKNNRIMATKEDILTIIRDIHLATGHKEEKKTYLKICENYANVENWSKSWRMCCSIRPRIR